MVPCSRVLDPMFRYHLGKTVVLVWQRRAPASPVTRITLDSS